MTRARLLFAALAAGLALLAAGLALEAAVRLSGRYPTAGVCPDPLTGWRYCRGYRRRARGPEGAGFLLAFDRSGFRDSGHAAAKPPGVRRVLLLGDSYTAGTALPRERTVAGLLERALNEEAPASGARVEVFEAAVAAWATDQQLLYLEAEGVRLRPDCVLLLAAPNDIREAAGKRFFSLEGGELRRLPRRLPPLRTRLLWRLAAGSALFQFLQAELFHTRYGDFSRIFKDFPATFPLDGRSCMDADLFLKAQPQGLERAGELFDALVLEAARVSRGAGAVFIAAVVPTRLEFDGRLDPGAAEPGRVSERVRLLALRAGMPFVDLFAALKRREDFRSAFLAEDYHLSADGHALVAAAVLPAVRAAVHPPR